MAIYTRWYNEGKSFSKLFMSSMQALHIRLIKLEFVCRFCQDQNRDNR